MALPEPRCSSWFSCGVSVWYPKEAPFAPFCHRSVEWPRETTGLVCTRPPAKFSAQRSKIVGASSASCFVHALCAPSTNKIQYCGSVPSYSRQFLTRFDPRARAKRRSGAKKKPLTDAATIALSFLLATARVSREERRARRRERSGRPGSATTARPPPSPRRLRGEEFSTRDFGAHRSKR